MKLMLLQPGYADGRQVALWLGFALSFGLISF